jgi:hypothetical protein
MDGSEVAQASHATFQIPDAFKGSTLNTIHGDYINDAYRQRNIKLPNNIQYWKPPEEKEKYQQIRAAIMERDKQKTSFFGSLFGRNKKPTSNIESPLNTSQESSNEPESSDEPESNESNSDYTFSEEGLNLSVQDAQANQTSASQLSEKKDGDAGINSEIERIVKEDIRQEDLMQHANYMYESLYRLADKITDVQTVVQRIAEHSNGMAHDLKHISTLATNSNGSKSNILGSVKSGLGMGAKGVALGVGSLLAPAGIVAAGTTGLVTGVGTATVRRATNWGRGKYNEYNDILYHLTHARAGVSEIMSISPDKRLDKFLTLFKDYENQNKKQTTKINSAEKAFKDCGLTSYDIGILEKAIGQQTDIRLKDVVNDMKLITDKYVQLRDLYKAQVNEPEFLKGKKAQEKQLVLYLDERNQATLTNRQLYSARTKKKDSSFLGLGARAVGATKSAFKYLTKTKGGYTRKRLGKHRTFRVRAHRARGRANAAQ